MTSSSAERRINVVVAVGVVVEDMKCSFLLVVNDDDVDDDRL
jgi:hypothetical protein